MDNTLYSFSALPTRPPLRLPEGKRLAVYVVVAVERYSFDAPGMSIAPHAAHFKPDPINYGWRDYGPRVGIWRLMDLFERYGVPVTAALNSDACAAFPEIISEGNKRAWSWVTHGTRNNNVHQNMGADEESALLREITETITTATGQRPRGWIGPILSETFDTPRLLHGLGYDHVLDWGAADDQPFLLDQGGNSLVSVPYALELNDATLFVGRNFPGRDYEEALVDQFEVLYREGAGDARVMNISLHPWITGQAFRMKYLENAIAHIAGHEDIWWTTSDAITDWYLGETGVQQGAEPTRSGPPSPVAGR
jgi:allantoinase